LERYAFFQVCCLFFLLCLGNKHKSKKRDMGAEAEDEVVYRQLAGAGCYISTRFVGGDGSLGYIPAACKRYIMPLNRLGFSPQKAMRVIRRLNYQRKIGSNTAQPTREAVNIVLLGMGLTNHIKVKFHRNPFRPKRPKRRGDVISTASTDGSILNIYVGIIRDAAFERKPGYLGIKRPRWVSHYAAVVLHELGHIIHKKLRLNRRIAEDILGDLGVPDCVLDPSKFQSRTNWAEWFADTFSTSFILHARRVAPRQGKLL
jgi:hypothetical protein